MSEYWYGRGSRPLEYGPPHEPDTVAEEMLEELRRENAELRAVLREWLEDVEHEDHRCCDWSQHVIRKRARRALAPTEIDG